MPGNQRPGSGVWDGALGDPRDMAKAGLLETQSPVMELRILRNGAWNRCPCPAPAMKHSRGILRDAGRCPARALKEMSGAPKSRSTRMAETNVGSPTGREPYGDGGLVVVVGVTAHQGGRESRPQGEGGQVIGYRGPGGMRNAERRSGTGCPRSLESRDARKAGTSGSAGGRTFAQSSREPRGRRRTDGVFEWLCTPGFAGRRDCM